LSQLRRESSDSINRVLSNKIADHDRHVSLRAIDLVSSKGIVRGHSSEHNKAKVDLSKVVATVLNNDQRHLALRRSLLTILLQHFRI
jgi:hypothetical protein